MINRSKITKEEYQKLAFNRSEFTIIRYKDYIKNLSFISGLTPKLIELVFGKSDFKYKGEYNCDCWGLDFNGDKFMIVSADGRGTTIESLTSDKKVISHFYDELLNLFLKIDNPDIERLCYQFNYKGWYSFR
jgi:hypothetical protein